MEYLLFKKDGKEMRLRVSEVTGSVRLSLEGRVEARGIYRLIRAIEGKDTFLWQVGDVVKGCREVVVDCRQAFVPSPLELGAITKLVDRVLGLGKNNGGGQRKDVLVVPPEEQDLKTLFCLQKRYVPPEDKL